MTKSRLGFVATCCACLLGAVTCHGLSADELEQKLSTIALPDGFSIGLYASDVANARSLVRGDHGTIFVGSRVAGKVYALVDADGDHKADKTYTIYTLGDEGGDKKRYMPNGVAFKDGSLYVATVSSVLRFDDIEGNLESPPKPVVVIDDYPTERHHGWKFIAFGPDEKLYVPVGAPCNDCDRDEDIYATITSTNPDGTGREIVAHGVRNTVGFDWHPETGELWFTDNGRDMMGDDMPADELNRLETAGQHFGYPYIHQGDTPDPNHGAGHDPADYVAPAQKLLPHTAALGMRFYTGAKFPDAYTNQIFIAEHGSWNRSAKQGYRVSLVRLEDNQAVSYEPFASGWLDGQENWGRPTDLLILPDGSMLVSDDHANAIYRISYDK